MPKHIKPLPQIIEEEKRRRFFYAMLEAQLYDATIEWVCPYYRLLHDTLVALVGLHIAQRPKGGAQDPYYVLDIGVRHRRRILEPPPEILIHQGCRR